MMAVSDISVVIRIKDGDIRAFEKLFRQYYEPLCRYAASFTQDTDVAEEIVQELFYTIWKEHEHLRIFLSLKSYLYKAARNNALEYLSHLNVREKYRERCTNEFTEESLPATPLEELEYKELQKQIAEALDLLPERRQQIFRMHRFEGKKYAEIAREFSISVKTVEVEISKALQALKKITGEQGI